MNLEDERIVKRIVGNCIHGVLSLNHVKQHADYLLNNELPIIYQFEEDTLNGSRPHNFNYINNYIDSLRDPTRSVLDLGRRHAYETAASFISYTMLRVFDTSLKERSIPNMCVVPVPTAPSQPAYYAEWSEILQRVEHCTGVRECMEAYSYWGVRDPHRHRESEGLPVGFIDTIALANEESEYANVVLVIDRMYRGTEMLEMKHKLEENGHTVILGICLSRVIL